MYLYQIPTSNLIMSNIDTKVLYEQRVIDTQKLMKELPKLYCEEFPYYIIHDKHGKLVKHENLDGFVIRWGLYIRGETSIQLTTSSPLLVIISACYTTYHNICEKYKIPNTILSTLE